MHIAACPPPPRCLSAPRSLGSLFQSPRSEDESLLFPLGLRASNIWYSHHDSVTWIQPDLPDGLGAQLAQLGLASTYEDSGWCYVELTSSAIVKKKGGRLDLSKRGAAKQYHGATFTGAGGTIIGKCEQQRTPPILPTDMKTELEAVKKFTSKGDVSLCP